MGSQGRSRRDYGYDEGYHTDSDHGRLRHSSPPPKSYRARSSVGDDTRRRPTYAKDDSYYNPRDKYYLSGDDEPEDHPYFSRLREDPRVRDDSRSRYQSHSPSPTRYRSPSPDRRPQHRRDERGRHRQYDEDEDRRSRRSESSSVTGRRRSMTTGPPSVRDNRESRRDRDRYYPPSASRPAAYRKRSSTVPTNSSRRSRASSTASPERKPAVAQVKSRRELLASAARTAVEAGAVAAVKLRDDPSPWIGMKGTKVVTTALGAALVDTLVDTQKPNIKGGMRHAVAKQVATVALGNLVTKPAAKKTKMGRKQR